MIYVRIFFCQTRSAAPSFCTRSAPVKLSRQKATGATAPAAPVVPASLMLAIRILVKCTCRHLLYPPFLGGTELCIYKRPGADQCSRAYPQYRSIRHTWKMANKPVSVGRVKYEVFKTSWELGSFS